MHGSTTETTPDVVPVLLDVKETAALLGVSIRHVQNLTKEGRLPGFHKLGAAARWHKPTLERFLEKGQQQGASS